MKAGIVMADMADFMMRRYNQSTSSRIGGFADAKVSVKVTPSIGYTILTIGNDREATATLYLRPEETVALIKALMEAQ